MQNIRFGNSLWSIEVDSGSGMIFTGDDSGFISIFKLGVNKKYKLVQKLECSNISIFCLIYVPDLKYLLAAGRSTRILVFALQDNGQFVRKGHLARHADIIQSLCYNYKTNTLFSGCRDNTIIEWGIQNADNNNNEFGYYIRELKEHAGTITGLIFIEENNSKKLFSSSYDKTIRVWDLGSKGDVEILRGHNFGIVSICYDSDSKILVSSSLEATFKTWKFDEIKKCYVNLQTIGIEKNHAIKMVYLPKFKAIFTGDQVGKICVFSFHKGKLRKIIKDIKLHTQDVKGLAYDKKRDVLLSCGFFQKVQAFKLFVEK